MPDDNTQNYSNHAKFDPPFHFFLAPLALANVIVNFLRVNHESSSSNWWGLVMAVTLLVAIFKLRAYALKVQDRVIRLEERLRLQGLLPEPLRSRIGELTKGQLIALRFASDAEIPTLVAKALAEKTSAKDLKAAIVNWRPDTFRV